jgi:hypothetical protein
MEQHIDNEARWSLEQRVESLEHRLAQHEAMRSGAIDALSVVQGRIERLQARVAQTLPAPLEAARENMVLERIAVVKTEQRALREYFDELSGIVIEDHTTLREIVTLLRQREGRE